MHVSSENFSKSCKHEMTCRMKSYGHFRIICQTSFKFSSRSRTRKLLVFFKCLFKSFYIYREILFTSQFYSHLQRKSIGIKESKCFPSRNLRYFLSTSFKSNLKTSYYFFKFSDSFSESLTKFCLFHLKFLLDFFGIIFDTLINF